MKKLWERVRTSLWFVPGLLTGGAIVLALLTIWLDRLQQGRLRGLWFVALTGAEGARGVLGTIAGSIITVTGVVFSITVVALQLASSQFTPRVLRSFTQDRVTQLVLGVFIGTFTYALLVLRTVRSEVEDYDRFVPVISVTISTLLALVSVAFLIYFVHHIARSIQAEVIVERVTRDALATTRRSRAERDGDGNAAVPDAAWSDAGARALVAPRSGYIQGVDDAALVDLAERNSLQLRLCGRIGDFVYQGDAIMTVHGETSDRVRRRLHLAIDIGAQRTGEQDTGRGLIELSDIAVRALSPGINDPTTAIVCVDRLSEVMLVLCECDFRPLVRRRRDGQVAFQMERVSWPELVRLAYRPLRQHSARDATVSLRLAQSLNVLLERVPAQCRAPLQDELRAVVHDCRQTLTNPGDIERIEQVARAHLPATS